MCVRVCVSVCLGFRAIPTVWAKQCAGLSLIQRRMRNIFSAASALSVRLSASLPLSLSLSVCGLSPRLKMQIAY